MLDVSPADLYRAFQSIDARPEPFSVISTAELWTEPHTARQMLAFHLDQVADAASRNHAFVDASADWLADSFVPRPGQTALDLGCGPGLYTTRLARRGVAVTGVDFSATSLAYARAQADELGLSIDYQLADYLHWESERRYDLITMIMCDFCVFSPAQRGAMLDRFARHLAPGGALVFDAYTLAAFARRPEFARWSQQPADNFWSAEPCFELHLACRYDEQQVTLDKYTLLEPERTRTLHIWHQFLDPDALSVELAEHGLRVEAVLGDVGGGTFHAGADEFAFVARLR